MTKVAVALVDSLLTAMVRANGDALVMHVGERPIVVAGARTIDLSSHGMNVGAMVGMLGQLLSADALAQLKEYGAVEHQLPSRGDDRFSVIAARSGEDIWIEIRRRRRHETADAAESGTASPSAPAVSAAEAPGVKPAGPLVEARAPEVVAASSAGEREDNAHASVVREVEWATSPEPPEEPVEAAGVPSPEPASQEAVEIAPRRLDTEPERGDASEPESEPVPQHPAPGLTVSAGADATPVEWQPDDDTLRSDGHDAGGRWPDEARAEIAVGEQTEAVAPEADDSHSANEWQGAPDQVPPALAEFPTQVRADAAERERLESPAVPYVDAPPALATGADVPPREEPAELRAEAEAPVVRAGAEGPVVRADEEAAAEDAAAEAVGAKVSEPVAVEYAGDRTATADVPQMPVLASAGASNGPPAFSPLEPMEAASQSGSPLGGPPPHTLPQAPAADAPASGASNGSPIPEMPLTRTVRIEVPARSSNTRPTGIDRLLRAADAAGASDLFLMSQARPFVRVGGQVRPLQDEAVAVADVEALIADVTPEPWRDAVRRGDPAEWLIELPELGRVRCSTFRDHRGPGANFHFAFLRAVSADELGLSAEARLLATEPDGLIVIGGHVGNDMATLVAAFIDVINQQRADYIVTLEPAVRVPHQNRQALISQREVGADPARVVAAAKAALREDPDVLVIEGVTSPEVARLTVDAAAEDRLVIASVDAPSASAAVRKLVALLPEDVRAARRALLARHFRGAVAQLLLRRTAGGRVAARELMIATRALSGVLATGDLTQLADQLESGRDAGMTPFVDVLVDLVRRGDVDVREALRKAPDPARLGAALDAAGVDVSAARWR